MHVRPPYEKQREAMTYLSLILIVTCTSLNAMSETTAETAPILGRKLNWNFAAEMGFMPYKTVLNEDAIFSMEMNVDPKDGAAVFTPSKLTKLTNPRLKGTRNLFALYPLVPMGAEPIEVRFWDAKKSPIIPNFSDLIEEDHFVWKPRDIRIKMKSGTGGGHTQFSFPIGMTFVHRFFLKDKKRTPLEIRYTQLQADGTWKFGIYDPDLDVTKQDDQNPLFTERKYNGSKTADRPYGIRFKRYVPPFEYPKFGKVSFSYPAVKPSDCMNCHSAGIDLSKNPDFQIGEFKKYVGKLRSYGVETIEDYKKAIVENDKYTTERGKLEIAETNRRKKEQAKIQNPSQPVAKESNDEDDENEEAKADAEAADQVRAVDLKIRPSKYKDFGTIVGPNRDPEYEKQGSRLYSPCGFVEEGDVMPFFTKINAWARASKKENKAAPFERVAIEECSGPELKIGQVVTIDKSPFFIDQNSNSWIMFRIIEQDSSGLFHAEPINGFEGVKLQLGILKDKSITYEMIFPGKTNLDFDRPVNGQVRYAGCQTTYAQAPPERVADHSGHGGGHGQSPGELNRSSLFWNIHAIQDLFGVKTSGPSDTNLNRSKFATPGHTMITLGKNIGNNWVVKLEGRFSLTDSLTGGIPSAGATGEYSKDLKQYVHERHPHRSFVGLEPQLGFRFGQERQNSIFFTAAPVGQAPAGAPSNFERPGEFLQMSINHHFHDFHTVESPIRVDLKIGKATFSGGVFSGWEPLPSSMALKYRPPDSWGVKGAYRLRGGRDQVGYSFSSGKMTHAVNHEGENNDGRDGHTVESERERNQVAWYMMSQKIKRAVVDVAVIWGQKQNLDERTRLNAMTMEFVTRLSKLGVVARVDVRQGLCEEFQQPGTTQRCYHEVRVTDVQTGAQWIKKFDVGFFKTLVEKDWVKITALASMSYTFLPPKFASVSGGVSGGVYGPATSSLGMQGGVRIQFKRPR